MLVTLKHGTWGAVKHIVVLDKEMRTRGLHQKEEIQPNTKIYYCNSGTKHWVVKVQLKSKAKLPLRISPWICQPRRHREEFSQNLHAKGMDKINK